VRLEVPDWPPKTQIVPLGNKHFSGDVDFNLKLLEYFYIKQQRNLVLKFESLRLDLNHKLSVILYEQQRLQSYLDKIKVITQLRKSSLTANNSETDGQHKT